MNTRTFASFFAAFLLLISFALSCKGMEMEMLEENNDSTLIQEKITLAKKYMNTNSDTAMIYAREAYELCKQEKDLDNQGVVSNIMGILYRNKGQYDKSLFYHMEAASLFSKAGNARGEAFACNNIGNVYYRTAKYDDAQIYYERSLVLKLKLGLQKDVSSTYVNLANIFMKKKQYDSCEYYYTLALKNARKYDDETNISLSLMNLGETYFVEKKYNKALKLYNEALTRNIQGNNQVHIANCHYAMGKIFMEKKEYAEAHLHLAEALKIIQETGVRPTELNVYRTYAQLFEKQQDYKQAYLYYKKYHELNDTIFNSENAQRIDEMKLRYESALKDEQISLLNKDNAIIEAGAQRERILRNSFIVAFVLIGIICVVLVRNGILKQRTNILLSEKNKQNEIHQQEIELKNKALDDYNQELRKENISARYEILKSKINPHFLFNSMSTLSFLIVKDQKKALAFVSSFSKLYRNILELGNHPLVSLKEEMDFAWNYLNLQKFRFTDNLEIEVHIPPHLLHYQVPPFSVQLILENAIKHNVITSEQKLRIRIEADEDAIRVINNVQKKTIFEPSTGIGQQSIIDRYRLFTDKQPLFEERNGTYVASMPLMRSKLSA